MKFILNSFAFLFIATSVRPRSAWGAPAPSSFNLPNACYEAKEVSKTLITTGAPFSTLVFISGDLELKSFLKVTHQYKKNALKDLGCDLVNKVYTCSLEDDPGEVEIDVSHAPIVNLKLNGRFQIKKSGELSIQNSTANKVLLTAIPDALCIKEFNN